MTVKDNFHRLERAMYEIIATEQIDTFPNIVLKSWIKMLKNFDFQCPCTQFGYEIGENCLFYENEEYYCEDCKECHPEVNDCGDCGRSEDWYEIRDIHNVMPSMALWVGLYLAQELEKLL